MLSITDGNPTNHYGKYAKTPASELEVREKFERKASMEAEEETWKLVKDSNRKKDFEYFLEKFAIFQSRSMLIHFYPCQDEQIHCLVEHQRQ